MSAVPANDRVAANLLLFCSVLHFFLPFRSYPVFPGFIHILSVLWIFYAKPRQLSGVWGRSRIIYARIRRLDQSGFGRCFRVRINYAGSFPAADFLRAPPGWADLGSCLFLKAAVGARAPADVASIALVDVCLAAVLVRAVRLWTDGKKKKKKKIMASMNSSCYSVAMDLGVCQLRNFSISFLSSLLSAESSHLKLDNR